MNRKLLLLTLPFLASSVLAQTTPCSELFFSEYVEGSSQNKALEIYNPTGSSINLSNYVIKRYSNGAFVATESLVLSGMLAPFDVVVVTNGQTDSTNMFGFVDPVLYAMGDINGTGDHADSPMFFNGNDALTLETLSGTVVDIFGKIGEDPGNSWTDDPTANYTDANGGTWWTRNQTLIRKPSIESGVLLNPGSFNPTLEWDSLPQDTWTELGAHACDCGANSVAENNTEGTLVVFFPNPVTNGQLQIQASSSIQQVKIYNVTGEVVLVAAPTGQSDKLNMNVEDLVTGMYLVRTDIKGQKAVTQRLTIR